ncbi:MAG: iron-containing alcohol dehydrogenase, partial [Gammaproteobacteria bacterium]
SPTLVDAAVREFGGEAISVVIGVGGGSALDAAKAIAGLLKVRRTVMDYLEGVGPELRYEGPAVPFIAVPTTAGTGSEATKNAVLSVAGPNGFKKSFRDDRLVAEYAIVDPDLLASCPPPVIAANGMDALTQLIESYVSIKANPFTDALAISGLRAARDGLLPWYEATGDAHEARAKMAYAALLSGITLAQTGLGSVHGLASPLGAFYPIPHGVVCGTPVAAATRVNIAALRERAPDDGAWTKYLRVAEILHERRFREREAAAAALVERLAEWTERLQLPRLRDFGLTEDGIAHVVRHSRGSSMKTNPIVLTDAEIGAVLRERL